MSQAEVLSPQPPQPPERRRRLWPWILGLGCGGMLLVCCGGIGVIGVVVSQVARGWSEDPKVIAEVRQGIAEIDVPPNMTPKFSLTLGASWLSQLGVPKMTWVAYGGNDASLILGDVKKTDVSEAERDQFMRQIEIVLAKQGQGRKQIVVENSEKQELVVRGKPAEFFFGQGHADGADKPFWQVTGTFAGQDAVVVDGAPGPTGTGVFVLTAPVDQFDKEHIVKIIESIR